jgi:hypothetical protein
MQRTQKVALMRKAALAGEQETEFVNDRLAEAFEMWLDRQRLGELTEDEEHDLRMAFEKGFGICIHDLPELEPHWLKPKLYKGKSMHEEELENVS